MKWLLIIMAALLLHINCSPTSTDDSSVKGYLIASPKGGETFRVGDSIEVEILADAAYSSVLELSIDGGTTWTALFSERIDIVKGTNTVKVLIPPTVTGWQGYDPIELASPTDKAKLRVYQYEFNTPIYVMATNFTIVAR